DPDRARRRLADGAPPPSALTDGSRWRGAARLSDEEPWQSDLPRLVDIWRDVSRWRERGASPVTNAPGRRRTRERVSDQVGRSLDQANRGLPTPAPSTAWP